MSIKFKPLIYVYYFTCNITSSETHSQSHFFLHLIVPVSLNSMTYEVISINMCKAEWWLVSYVFEMLTVLVVTLPKTSYFAVCKDAR